MSLQPAARLGGYLRANPQLVVSALIATALLWSVASIVRTRAAQPHAGAGRQPQGVDLQAIRAAHLFGSAPQAASSGDAAAGMMPLVLVGTLVNKDGAAALAIVSAGDPPDAHIFRVGDRLPGGAILLEVRAQSILVEREAGTEMLGFPRRFGAALAALLPGTVDELAADDAVEAPHIYATRPDMPKTEDYYSEQQAALLGGTGGS